MRHLGRKEILLYKFSSVWLVPPAARLSICGRFFFEWLIAVYSVDFFRPYRVPLLGPPTVWASNISMPNLSCGVAEYIDTELLIQVLPFRCLRHCRGAHSMSKQEEPSKGTTVKLLYVKIYYYIVLLLIILRTYINTTKKMGISLYIFIHCCMMH